MVVAGSKYLLNKNKNKGIIFARYQKRAFLNVTKLSFKLLMLIKTRFVKAPNGPEIEFKCAGESANLTFAWAPYLQEIGSVPI